MAELRFDESQVGAILQRAAELQSLAEPTGELGSTSLPELQRLAAEIGIEPSLVAQAADEIARRETKVQVSHGGTMLVDRSVPGNLSTETWVDMIAELRQFAGSPGRTETHGTTNEWICRADKIGITFTSSQSGDDTRLRLVADTGNVTAIGWLGGPIFGFVFGLAAGAATGTHVGLVAGLEVGVAVAGAVGGLAYLIVRGITRRVRVGLAEVMGRVLRLAQPGG